MDRTTAIAAGAGLSVLVLCLSFVLLHYGNVRGWAILTGITPVLIALAVRKARGQGCGSTGRKGG